MMEATHWLHCRLPPAMARGCTRARWLAGARPADHRAERVKVDVMGWERTFNLRHLTPMREDTDDNGVSGAQGRLAGSGFEGTWIYICGLGVERQKHSE